MSHGIRLLASIVHDKQGLQKYTQFGLMPELFKGDNEKVFFEVFSAHVEKYGAIPSVDALKEAFKQKKVSIKVPETKDSPAYYRDKVIERYRHLTLKDMVYKVQDYLVDHDYDPAIELMKELALADLQFENHQQLIDFAASGASIIKEELTKIKLLGTSYGIKFGWPYLDNMIGGLIGGDVASLVGRPAMGKTYQLLFGAMNAWQNDNKVPLFVSMEMNVVPIVQRLTAMTAKVAITHLKKAMLDTPSTKRLNKVMASHKDKQPFWIIDGRLSSTVQDIWLLCNQLHPDVLYIDGAYLLRHANKRLNRWDRVTENAEDIKRMAEALNIPVVISYQFNRKATQKKEGAPGVENIAYTDAIGQLSSIVLGLMQQEGVETLNQRRIEVLKGRSGEIGHFDINWRFDCGPDYMCFDQIENKDVGSLSWGL